MKTILAIVLIAPIALAMLACTLAPLILSGEISEQEEREEARLQGKDRG